MPARDNDKERIKELETEVAHLQKQVDDLEQKVQQQSDWGNDVTWKLQQAEQQRGVHADALKQARADGYRAAAVLGGPDFGPDVKQLDEQGNWKSVNDRPDTANRFWIEELGFKNPRLGGDVSEFLAEDEARADDLPQTESQPSAPGDRAKREHDLVDEAR